MENQIPKNQTKPPHLRIVYSREKAKRRLGRAFQRATYSVLMKYPRIPIYEDSPEVEELRLVLLRIARHALKLRWIANVPEVFE